MAREHVATLGMTERQLMMPVSGRLGRASRRVAVSAHLPLNGSAGNDHIVGGIGNDILYGGEGDNNVMIAANQDSWGIAA
jgi:hypothetical protein